MKKGVISVLSMLTGVAAGAGTVGKIERDKLAKAEKLSGKHLALFLMMNQWVKVKQEGKQLASYFEGNGYYKIAIYGMSYAGETLIDELKGSDITIAYGIDQRADSIYTDIDVIALDDNSEQLEQVDAVVVTAITFFDEIEEKLLERIDCPIISLEDILYDV